MTTVHAVLGIACAAGLGMLIVWALFAKVALRRPGKVFERAALLVAGLLAVQVLFGLILLATGHRKGALHYVYGIAALAALAAGTGLARALQRDRWVVLAWTAFGAGLLVLRALMTGYGKA